MERWRLFGRLTLLSIVFLAGLFAMGEAGRLRLGAAMEEIQAATERKLLVGELRQQVAEAALASRNLLLTERPEYVEELRAAVNEIGARAETLVQSYVGAQPAVVDTARRLRYLAGVQTGKILSLLQLYATGDANATRELARAQSPSPDPLGRFLVAADRLERYETARLQDAQVRWRDEQTFYRRLGIAGLALNVLLVLSASLMVHATLRRHREGLAELAQRHGQLEREATAHATELNDVYGHLQTLQEQERSSIARGLHDELGGLLLAARMDATWLRRHAGETPPAVAERIERVIDSLDRSIDLKRRVIEQLRPTLLDNMGLLAAIRWRVDESCRLAGLNYACRFPADEPEVSPPVAIALFRVVQSALDNVVRHAAASRVEVTLAVAGERLELTIEDDGRGIDPSLQWSPAHGLAGMRHRITALGGTLSLVAAPGGGTSLHVAVPRLARPQ